MPTEIEGVKFYTITEVAEALKVNPQTVRGWVKRGRLKGRRVGRPILIAESNIREFLQLDK
jgi:excisionase family DNA binding protein